MRFAVVIDGPELVFRATHAVAFPQLDASDVWIGEEPHEHEFKVSARIEGPLDDSDCVVDFIAARKRLVEILARLDGRRLLARRVPYTSYRLVDNGDTLEIEWLGAPTHARYRTPVRSVVWYDAKNASAEIVAASILGEWFDSLTLSCAREEYKASLRLEEAPGSFVETTL